MIKEVQKKRCLPVLTFQTYDTKNEIEITRQFAILKPDLAWQFDS